MALGQLRELSAYSEKVREDERTRIAREVHDELGSLLVALVGFGRLPGLWMILPIVILAREFLVSGLREYLGPKNVQVPVSPLAKWKTAVQMTALGFLIIGPHIPFGLYAGQWILTVAAILTVVTGGEYLKAGLKDIK